MRAHQDMVFTTAARLLGNDAQAEDIAQEVFLKAFERFERLRASPAAGGWLRTVTRHASLNHLTRHRRRWRLFSELGGPRTDSEGTGEPTDLGMGLGEGADGSTVMGARSGVDLLSALEAEQRHALIEEALRTLPPAQRVVLVLYHFEELSYEQIASQLRISLAKVKTDMHRGRSSLLAALQASGVARELALDLSADATAAPDVPMPPVRVP
jgi:RNA polymerase sigma-70 factor, ECF subfamily